MHEMTVKIRHATQCEFIPMTPVPDEWRGMRVRLIAERIPADEMTAEDRANVWPSNEQPGTQGDLL